MNAFRCLLAALMLLFIAVQFNDPDGPLWAFVYAVPVLLLAVVVVRRRWLLTLPGSALAGLAVLALAIATVFAWPQMPGFWKQAVWWEEETAREGMGLMIATVVAACALPVSDWWRRRGS